jgi:hypothetical protein
MASDLVSQYVRIKVVRELEEQLALLHASLPVVGASHADNL